MAEMKRGSVVLVTAGHDRGIYHVVLEVTEDGYALIAEGKLRKTENPKKKNPRHLKVLRTTASEEDLETNNRIKKLLFPYNYGEQGKMPNCEEE